MAVGRSLDFQSLKRLNPLNFHKISVWRHRIQHGYHSIVAPWGLHALLQTREATEPTVGTRKSILEKSGVRVMKSSVGENMAVGKGEPWGKGHTWTTTHLGE